MIRRLIALAAAAALLPTSAHAYGYFGHETIARIALKNVTPRTLRKVRALLARTAVLDTPECKTDTIGGVASWADCVRAQDERYKATGPWHYQDVEICQPFDLQPACKDGNCVSAQITRDIALLRDPHTSRHDRVEALAFLIHFVGDLHQPLHAGEKADKGGNDVKASYGAFSYPRLNLHSIWDTQLAERAITTGPDLVRRYTPGEKARLSAGDVTDWSRQSWQVVHDTVYATALHGDPCAPTPPHTTLSEADIEADIPAARLQIERAGLRLAKVLNRALG